MSELPSGTVSMLFSDIEGSTLLLARLGPRYVDALDGHRQVLRRAWAAHGGTEMNTEGDSFFVVFPSAEAAVAAAAQAQRQLVDYPWPGGERVRVRIGIHTGSPDIYDGDYVGMDVHRAARIAASAHGGQVVMSAATAELARPSLPEGVGLRDLGSHRLKDIAAAEHLFQATIEGLPSDFPPLKTVGTVSSLPVPGTPLVGRERELDQLTVLMRSPEVRLVTLTGPGGSGKTRLAISVAQALVDDFAEGVYFVPLASATSPVVMWTSIAEVLNVPPTTRFAPALLDYVSNRCALFVLDNLEQLPGADDVVAQLLTAAPKVVVIATSRRALSVPGEHRHPVPPLALPEGLTLAEAENAGALQLFVQAAGMVQPTFRLTADNLGDVVAICRRLDGLPLGIELAAARLRLLSTKALLARLDSALDIAATGRQGPGRQRTLRRTIAWSHDLLTTEQQTFFRRLGVFADGANLDAIAAVTAITPGSGRDVDPRDAVVGPLDVDPLDLVAELVDASLAVIAEGPDGEPRVKLLGTIRDFAKEQLRVAGEADSVRRAHADHYLRVAEQLSTLRESQHLVARRLAEVELGNFREALRWARQHSAAAGDGSDDFRIGLRLCSALGWLWITAGYVSEGRHWYEELIRRADPEPSVQLADCLGGLASMLIAQGEPKRARHLATDSLEMARSLGDETRVAFALGVLGTAQQALGQADAARQTLDESVALHRKIGTRGRLARAVGNLAGVEESLGHFDRAEALTGESLSIFHELGDLHEATIQGQNLVYLLVLTGRLEEATDRANALVEAVVKLRSPSLTIAFADTYMNLLIRLGQPVPAAHLYGAEEAMRERNAMPNPHQQDEFEEAWARLRDQISAEEWEHHRRLGRDETVEDLLAHLADDRATSVTG